MLAINIQLEKISEKHGWGAYVFRMFIAGEDKCLAMITDKATVFGIIQSVHDPRFFIEWQKKLAMDDFKGVSFGECEPYEVRTGLGAAII